MSKKNKSLGSKVFDVFNTILMLFIIVITLYPMLYTISISLSDVNSVLTNSVTFFPKGINLNAYKYALEQPFFWVAYRNTVLYTALGTLVSLYLTCTLAYAISRKELIFRKTITLIIMLTLYFQGGMIARFITYKSLNLYNNIWAMILPFAINTYNLVVTRTFMEGIPEEIMDSAKVDGYNDIQIFHRIIIPLSKSAIATIGLFYAVGYWNQYFWPMVLFKDTEKLPLQVLLKNMIDQSTQVGIGMLDSEIVYRPSEEMIISATIVVALIPIICVYPYIQRYFIKGVMVGAVKG